MSCGLAQAPTMDNPELTQEEEEVGEQVQLPVEPKAKRRSIRPPSHSERMEQLHTNLLEEIKKQNEFFKEKNDKIIETQEKLLEVYQDTQEKRTNQLKKK